MSGPRIIVFGICVVLAVTSVSAQLIEPRPNFWPPGTSNAPVKSALAPLAIDDSPAVADLINSLLGTGVTVSNITSNCQFGQTGAFSGGAGILGINSGIMMSSGNVLSVPGPNLEDGVTTAWGTPGDPDLDIISGVPTFDACVITFDFECAAGAAQNVTFRYQFTSDEYNEYANSTVNDTFAFILNGSNIALLPDLVTPISINTVNGGNPGIGCFDSLDNDGDTLIDGADPDCTPGGSDNIVSEDYQNTTYFINNDCSDPDGGAPCPIDTEMDGLTTVQTATSSLVVGVNTIKLAIADGGDSILDSNVFLESGSLQCAETGACCQTGGLCTQETAADCAAIPGVYQGNGVPCTPGLCPVVPTTGEWSTLILTLLLLTGVTVTTAVYRVRFNNTVA